MKRFSKSLQSRGSGAWRGRRILWIVSCLCVAGWLLGCGEEEAPSETTRRQLESTEIEEHPERIPPRVMDSLRVRKKRYGISRDAYWDGKGGVLANRYFEVWYAPGRFTVTHAMHAFQELTFAREECRSFFGHAPEETLRVYCPLDLEDYRQRSGRDWWYYAEIREDQMIFQPILILVRRGLDAIAIPHEYFQWAIRKLSKGNAPRWLEEGLASYLSGEKRVLREQLKEFALRDTGMTAKEVEEILKGEEQRESSRIAYYHAYMMVEKLILLHTEAKLKEVILLMEKGEKREEAFSITFEKPYGEVLAEAKNYKVEI